MTAPLHHLAQLALMEQAAHDERRYSHAQQILAEMRRFARLVRAEQSKETNHG